MLANATRTAVETVLPTAGTIDKLYAQPYSSPGVNGYWVTVYKNGAPTGLTCRITSTATCSELTQTVSLVAGDLISVEGCPGMVTAPSAGCTPGTAPTSAPIHISVRWVPTTPGEYIVMANSPAGTPAGAANNYFSLSGAGINAVTTENITSNISPMTFTLKKLYFSLLTAPGGSAARAVTLRSGAASVGTPGALSATITGSATSGTDTTNSYQASSGNMLDWLASNPVATPSPTGGWRASVVVTVP
jgi:hypothetical protein